MSPLILMRYFINYPRKNGKRRRKDGRPCLLDSLHGHRQRTTIDCLFDWLLFLATVAVIIAVLIGQARISYGESDYWRSKVASAIAIETSLRTDTAEPSPPAETKEKAEPAKLIVVMYSAKWCAPCQRAKAELKGAKLPFELQIIDVDQAGWPGGLDTIPHFEWDSPRGKLFAKWNGVKDLIGRWELSQRPAPKHSTVTSKYRARWTWPGDLRTHLLRTHGIGNAMSMTQDQAEALHDQLHERSHK